MKCINLKKIKKDYENYMLEIGIEDIDEKTVTEELIPIFRKLFK